MGRDGSAFEAWEGNIYVNQSIFYGSYGYNQYLFTSNYFQSSRGINFYNIKRASRFPMLLDCIKPASLFFVDNKHNDFCIDRHDGYGLVR